MSSLRWSTLWIALGWMLLALVVALSLLPMPQTSVQVPGSDKFQHLIAYFAISFWHCQLQLRRPVLVRRLLLIALTGALVEVLQAQTGYRTGELRDLAANLIGVIFGTVIGMANGGWLMRLERRIEQLALRRGWLQPRDR